MSELRRKAQDIRIIDSCCGARGTGVHSIFVGGVVLCCVVNDIFVRVFWIVTFSSCEF